MSDKKTFEEAYENAIEMISDYFAYLIEEDEEVPTPSERREGEIMVPYKLP